MARPRKNINRRRKSGKGGLILILSGLLIVCLTAFFLLKKLDSGTSSPSAQKHAESVKQKMPERHPAQFPALTTHPPEQRLPAARNKQMATGGGKVAIIIDDMGASMSEVRKLMAPGLPLSFAVIPGLPRARQVAEEAHKKGFEVLIHLPMEPKGYPRQRIEKNGLLLSMTDAEVAERVEEYFRAVPHAVGANNHMGSRFTEDKGKMGAVLKLMKGKSLFFIDSRTTPGSVALSIAREMGLKSASRDVFLDNVQDVPAIRQQLLLLAATARKKGMAIGICHPHKKTIEALAETMPLLEEQGTTFMLASAIVK